DASRGHSRPRLGATRSVSVTGSRAGADDPRQLSNPQLAGDASLLAGIAARVLLHEERDVRIPALFDGIVQPRQIHHLPLIVRSPGPAPDDPAEADPTVSAEPRTPVHRREHGLIRHPPNPRASLHEIAEPLVLRAGDTDARPHVWWQRVP